MPDPENVLLKMEHITKRFPGTLALCDVNFDLRAGEVHVLLGENGAGKSTLMKILAGAYQRDGGTIYINGRETSLVTPQAAQEAGVSIIYQELTQVPQLTVAENIFLGREITNGPVIDWKATYAKAKELLGQVDADFGEKTEVRKLSIAHRQMVEIAKAVSMNAKIIIMDEPTSSLTPHDTKNLFKIIAELKSMGKGIIYISHHLEEIKEIGDRATVLRDGKYIASFKVKDHSIEQIIEMMVGRSIDSKYPKIKAKIGKEALRAEHLSRVGYVNDASFAVREGEVLGLAGLVGAGRTELCRLLFGADQMDGGKVFVSDQKVDIRSPEDAIRHQIGFLTENRKEEGLVLHQSITNNISLPILRTLSRSPFPFIKIIDHKRDESIAQEFYRKLNIRAPSIRKRSGELSGGNQQKVVFAKWIATNSRILIIDEPTRGIDVGAKAEIYGLINELAAQGVAIIMVSSELPEILGMADRILVMCGGRITGELTDPETFTQEAVMQYAVQFTKDPVPA